MLLPLVLLACLSSKPPVDDDSADDSGEIVLEDTGTIDTTEPPLRAVWVSHIKNMDNPDPSSRHCSEGGWYRNDTEAMRSALLEVGADIFIGNIDNGDTEDCWFLNFDDMAAAADNTVQLAGSMKTGQDLGSHLVTMTALRERAAANAEVVALVVDDFQWVHRSWLNPGGNLWPEDVAAIYDRGHETGCGEAWCGQPEVGFWPYMTATQAAAAMLPSWVLGAGACSSDCPPAATFFAPGKHGGDMAAMDWSWSASGAAGSLRFLVFNKYSGDEGSLSLQVTVDGAVLLREPLEPRTSYEEDIQLVEVALPAGEAGERGVQIAVVADEDSPPEADRRVQVWGIEVDDGAVYAPAYDAVTLSVERDTDRPELADDDGGWVQALSNAEWQIFDAVDGLLLHHMVSEASYDPDSYAHILRTMCEPLSRAGKLCLATFWGNDQWFEPQSTALIAENLEIADQTTGGVVVYRYSLDSVGEQDGVPPALGVYQEVSPIDTEDYDVMAYWPSYTRGIPGWQHTWEADVPCDGEYRLSWADGGGAVGRFTKSLHLLEEDGSESTLYSADPAVDGDSGEVVFSAEAGSGLRLGFREDASVGNLKHYAQLRVEAISGTCAGERLTDWEHEAAVDEALMTLHRCYTTHFQTGRCVVE